jgi:hypothetical protein
MQEPQAKTSAHTLRRTIVKLVRNTYTDCKPEFVGDESLAAPRSHAFGFRIIDRKGKPRTGVIWLNPSFYKRANKAWLEDEVRRLGGLL